MCLYPKLILNKRFIPNKKNGFNPPKLTDERIKYVAVGCGNCIECRKQKSRQWQIRLSEELKVNKGYFVTLTFTNENLNELCNTAKKTECNAIAGIAVRRFLERWRKKHKKSLRHWLVTELGHEGTERIHLHGIIFTNYLDKAELQEMWKYGFTDVGEYCNTKTINYIVKYITKLDNDHKQYRAEIFCSAGLGRNYVNKYTIAKNKYKPDNTNETYRFDNGNVSNLPIYYRNKIYTEEERQNLWVEKIEKHEIYVMGVKIDISTEAGLQNYNDILETAQKFNIQAGFGTDEKEWQKKDYNVTLRMLNAKSKLQKVRNSVQK